MEQPLRFSPSELINYLTCPRQYYLAYVKKYEAIPLPSMKEGRLFHKVILNYYNSIPDHMTAGEIPLFLSMALKRSGLNEYEEIRHLIFGFSKFESDRLSWHINSKPLSLEQKFERGNFYGIVDAIFSRKNERIGVDWKSAWNINTNKNSGYIIQGFIYTYIAKLDEMLFVPLFSGRAVRLTKNDLPRFKNLIKTTIDGILEQKFDQRNTENCENCPYSLACKGEDEEWTL